MSNSDLPDSRMYVNYWPKDEPAYRRLKLGQHAEVRSGPLGTQISISWVDAQRLLDDMIDAGMRPTGRICVKKGDLR